jgi:hypothetical protein
MFSTYFEEWKGTTDLTEPFKDCSGGVREFGSDFFGGEPASARQFIGWLKCGQLI